MPEVKRSSWTGKAVGRTSERQAPISAPVHASETLMARAKKRTVRRIGKIDGATTWRVDGDPKLGDSYREYHVTLAAGSRKYGCSCYSTTHGESRRRKMCSHVLAVVLARREGSESEAPEVPQPDAEGPVPRCQAPAPAPLPSPVRTASSAVPARLYPTSPQVNPQGWKPPPSWLTTYRDHQIDAIEECVEAFESGSRLVYLDAPTGSGKTAIADAVARKLGQRGLYVCSGIQLQQQFLDDYPYARVIKGKRNYPTQHGPDEVTCDDCDGTPGNDDCSYCDYEMQCPYREAKLAARMAQTPVLNSAYWLREAQQRKASFSRPDGLVILDECDTLEDVMMGFIEFRLTKTRLKDLGIEAPKPRLHKKTIATWLLDELRPSIHERLKKVDKNSLAGRRRIRGYQELFDDARRIAESLQADSDNWIRDNSDDFVPLAYKPVTVAPFGPRMIWRHAGRALLMSATIISPDQMNSDLGWTDEYSVVRVPMTFPVENRQINMAGVASMTYAEKDEAWPKMAHAISVLMVKHAGERILVHTVSRALSKYLIEHPEIRDAAKRVGMKLITYTDGPSRDQSLRTLRGSASGILFAHSFDRGVDLKDDDCRVVIVAKIPFPSLGDPQVSARSHGPDGNMWYAVRTVRSLVQMTGRGVRNENDWCVSYILDRQFELNIWKRHKNLLPEWWREALNRRYRVRELLA